MVTHPAVNHLRSGLIWLCLLALCSLAIAQSSAPPIQIGQNIIGQLSATASTVQYTLTATAGETAQVLVLSASPGFAASVTVTNDAGVAILSLPNTSAQPTLSGSVSFDDAGIYTITVGSANGTFGQFALSLQAGTPLPQPVDLNANQPITDTVGSDTPVRVYRFSTSSATPSLLTILSGSSDTGLFVSLFDEDANRTIASNDAGISGIAYRLPPQDRHYHVEVRANGSASSSFSICLGDCGGSGLLSAQATGEPQTVAITPTVAAAQATCTVAPGISGSINVRSGPSTIYAIIGNLSGAQTAPVLGQLSSESWLEINLNGQTGWVAASVTKTDGDCTALATVAPPANAPLAPTVPPPTVPPPTNAPSGGGSGKPHPTATTMPTAAPTTASSASSLPDLTISIDDAIYAANPSGYIADVQYTVKNLGDQNVLNPAILVDVEVCISTSCETSTNYGLPPFTKAINVTFTAPADSLSIPITAKIFAYKGSGGDLADSNENNNTTTYSLILHPVSISPHR